MKPFAVLALLAGLAVAPATAQTAQEPDSRQIVEQGGNDCSETGRNAPIVDGNGTDQLPGNVDWCAAPDRFENPVFGSQKTGG